MTVECASFGQGMDHFNWAKEAMESAGAANTVEYVGDLVDHDPPWIAGTNDLCTSLLFRGSLAAHNWKEPHWERLADMHVWQFPSCRGTCSETINA